MTDTRTITENAQNQTLEFVRQSQEAFIEAMQVWSDSLNRLVGSAQERTPGAADVPKPDEVLDQVFDFAQSLLTAQREFAHNVLRTTSNIWATGEQVAAQETQKSASAAKRTSTKA